MIGKSRFIAIVMATGWLTGISPLWSEKIVPRPVDLLAGYVSEARYGDFPAAVIKRAKYLILDSIGCALGGTQLDLGQDYLKSAPDIGTGSEATVIGSGTRVSLLTAAYINTQLANVLDFDDTYDLYSPGHPGCGIVHTALAVAEAQDSSGKELLTAVILGYEVCLRIGRAEGYIDWQWPLYVDSMTRGTATVACRLFRLNQRETVVALGHGLELPPQRRGKFDMPADMTIPEIKSHFGIDAIKGIIAARLAQQDITGWESVLQGDLKKWYLQGGEIANFVELTKDLGKTYRLMEVSFKPTPSCRLTHAPITALWKALGYRPVRNKDIKEITVRGVERLNRPGWETWLQAQFSMQCAVALAASGTEPGPAWYTSGRFKDPDIVALGGKVRLENDTEAETLEIREQKVKCSVTVEFKDGIVNRATIRHVKGAPGDPMTDEELRQKFKANTIAILPEKRLRKIIEVVLNLETLPRVSGLTKLLVSYKSD